MADAAVLLNISEMIDLAIGTPEVGVVDFCMLQTVLHCLAQQLRILGKNVELRGSMATLPVGKLQETAATLAVTEFTVDTSGASPGESAKVELVPPPPEQETILVVERIKRSPSPSSPSKSPVSVASRTPKTTGRAPSTTGLQRIGSTEKLSLVTISKFNILENVVEDLKNRVYGSMPKNEAILEEVRSQTNLKAITDMWTSLNVSSRLEAAEEGIAKLSSLVQDLIGETAALQGVAQGPRSTSQAAPKTAADPTDQTVGPDVQTLKNEIEGLGNAFKEALEDMAQIKNTMAQFGGIFGDLSEKPQVQDGNGPSAPPPEPSSAPVVPTTDANMINVLARLAELEKKIAKCCDTINKADGVMQDQLTSFQDQLQDLAKQLSKSNQSQAPGHLPPDLIKDMQGLMQLYQTVQDMKAQLSQINDTTLALSAEKEERQTNLQALLEQIELLKNIKLDREDMEEALADKADVRMLGRKVSHDQFEMACDDLSRGLEHAVGKLHIQEALWQQALDDIQREIETKLDKIDLTPVKDFFTAKLKQLQDNVKQLSSLRREVEAAGSKKKLFTNVNCISCDANAVMNAEAPPSIPVSKPMPASMSMKPYLCYELDTIRRSQMTNVPQRNLHDWETMGKQMSGQSKPPPKAKSEADKDRHLCNRYCGGSHTVTTAAQRVARTGHFVKQWGPEVLPLSSGLATGDDGRLYKVTAEEPPKPGGAVEKLEATPKTPAKKEPEAPQGKPIIISAECRCLDYDPVKIIQTKAKSTAI